MQSLTSRTGIGRRLNRFSGALGTAWRYFVLGRYPVDGDACFRLRSGDSDAAFDEPVVSNAPTSVAPAFPVDAVFTWVDDSDPAFRRKYLAHLDEGEDVARSRVRSYDEILYALRSLNDYAPWVNRIHLVTDGQRPAWLAENEKLRVVDHSEILAARHLPTFNSHAIESALHRIPGLAEHYIYFNDDMMLTRPAEPGDFFLSDGSARAFWTDRALPPGDPSSADTPTEQAAKNAHALLEREWGKTPRRMFAHTFHPQRRSVAEETEARFADAFERCRGNRFRDRSDIYCTGFLHHYAGHRLGRAVFDKTRWSYLSIRERWTPWQYRELLSRRGRPAAALSMCVNDLQVRPSHELPDYAARLRAFLDSYFPHPSPFERRHR